LNRKIITLAGTLIVLTLGFLYYAGHGNTVPRGQPPLAYLDNSNLDSLRASFNQSSASIRVLLLLSPT
jgi:hypothetical protein